MVPQTERRTGVRVLVVAPNWLGDVIMTTPLLDWLDAARRVPGGPSLQIHLCVRAVWAPLFASDPRLDGLVISERPGVHDGWLGVLRQADSWKRLGFDAVLLGPPSFRAALVAARARIPRRIGHRGDGRSFLLTRAVKRRVRGALHFSREMMQLGEGLALEAGWPAGLLPAPDGYGKLGLPGCAGWGLSEAPSSRPIWAVGPGATFGEAKSWPAEPMADFLGVAVRDEGVRIMLLGDKSAEPLVHRLRNATPDLVWSAAANDSAGASDADVIDMTGRTSLKEAVAWLGASRIYVGNDSGLMHLAAALDVPTIGIFGSSNPDWTGPLGSRSVALAAQGFACRPCYRRICNQPLFCLSTLSGAHVLAAARSLLAEMAGEDRCLP